MNSTAELRVLVIETSGSLGQVALARDGVVVRSHVLDRARRHARDLAPAVAEMLKNQGWAPDDIQFVFVSRGPGSYTGLRVGIMSAKTFAYATGCAVLGVDTFAAIACESALRVDTGGTARLSVIADAQQEKVYCQRFKVENGEPRVETALAVLPLAQFLAERPGESWITGPGVRSFQERLSGLPMVVEGGWDATPKGIVQAGLRRLLLGESDDIWALEPLYHRPSSAEEKWDAGNTRARGV